MRIVDGHEAEHVPPVRGLFEEYAASIGVDITLGKHVLWRAEARGFHSPSAVWPTHEENHHSTHDGVVVTSLALSF